MSIFSGYTKFKFRRYGNYRQQPQIHERKKNSFKIFNKTSIHRRDNSQKQIGTEISNDVRTTDREVLAEEIITTSGKIPNKMYEIETTPQVSIIKLEQHLPRSRGIEVKNETDAQPSVLFVIVIITGSLIIFICMITCIIKKVKKKNYKTLSKKDVEYCTLNRPLLSMCEEKDSSVCCQN
ncbi:uncharacterized protein LOC127285107 isoform X2 [Leptopilina boulardi]|uniref:uncharacterized protein LOC127285107 isoform X2 n=1 Tax=Leptopilina boulardi TaxID=63433 RepID=UPI0021F618A4|nr:uncharacterized protein LOC127285107 isoform X2 [Leptopilina boulardi]